MRVQYDEHHQVTGQVVTLKVGHWERHFYTRIIKYVCQYVCHHQGLLIYEEETLMVEIMYYIKFLVYTGKVLHSVT